MISKILLGSMPDLERPKVRQLSFNQGNIYITVTRSSGTYNLIIHLLDQQIQEYKQFSLVVDHWVTPRQLNNNFLIISSWNKDYIFNIQGQKFEEIPEQSKDDDEDEDDWYPEYRGTQIFKLIDNKLMVTELANYPLIEEYLFSDSVKKIDFMKYGLFESISITLQPNRVQSFLLPLNKNQNDSQILRSGENTFYSLAGWLRNREIKIRYTVSQKQTLLLDVYEDDHMHNDNQIIAFNFFDYDVKVISLKVKKIVRKFKKSNAINPISLMLKHYLIERQIERKVTKIYNIITGRVIVRAETIIQIDDNIIVEREGKKLIVSKLVIDNRNQYETGA